MHKIKNIFDRLLGIFSSSKAQINGYVSPYEASKQGHYHVYIYLVDRRVDFHISPQWDTAVSVFDVIKERGMQPYFDYCVDSCKFSERT